MAQSTDFSLLHPALDVSDVSVCSQTLRAESQETIRLSKLSTADLQRIIGESRILIHETHGLLAAAKATH